MQRRCYLYDWNQHFYSFSFCIRMKHDILWPVLKIQAHLSHGCTDTSNQVNEQNKQNMVKKCIHIQVEDDKNGTTKKWKRKWIWKKNTPTLSHTRMRILIKQDGNNICLTEKREEMSELRPAQRIQWHQEKRPKRRSL